MRCSNCGQRDVSDPMLDSWCDACLGRTETADAYLALGGTLTGAELLDRLHAALVTYVVFPSPEAADAATLWAAATHAQPAWEHATRLVASSPQKRCGKSRLLDVIEAVCYRPLISVNISPAALARAVSDDPPTLLLDEADTTFSKSMKGDERTEVLRGLINAGHQRNRPYIRWDAARREQEECPTFAMAALAGIGDMPDTITDRAVVIAMRRRGPGESASPWRTRRDRPPLHDLGGKVHDWIRGHMAELTAAVPDLPVEDRAADNWEPLAAVADLAGGDWPARARKAAVVLTAEDESEATASVRLLADLRDVFGDADAMFGDVILGGLHRITDAPWADWYGKPLTARGLAAMLRPYGVRPVQVKVGGEGRKGYRREHLHDAWCRYLPRAGGVSETSETSATPQVSGHDQVSGFGCDPKPETGTPHLTSTVPEVSEVSEYPPEDARPWFGPVGDGDPELPFEDFTEDFTEDSKRCTKCGETKPLDAFGAHAQRRDGLNTWCKPCCAASGARWREANPDRQREFHQRYHRSHVAERRAKTRGEFHSGQDRTIDSASRRGQPWTGAELEIAYRADLTTAEAALILGRTFAGVQNQRKRMLRDGRPDVSIQPDAT